MDDSWKQSVEAGNAAFSEGRIEEAEIIFLKAVEAAEKFAQDDPRLALSLNNLAAVLHTGKKLTLAEPLYKRSLDIKLRIHGNEPHADIALNLHNLAVLYGARHMFPIAEEYLKQALAMKEALYGTDSRELLGSLRYYAALLKVMKRPLDGHLIEARIAQILKSDPDETPSQAQDKDGQGR